MLAFCYVKPTHGQCSAHTTHMKCCHRALTQNEREKKEKKKICDQTKNQEIIMMNEDFNGFYFWIIQRKQIESNCLFLGIVKINNEWFKLRSKLWNQMEYMWLRKVLYGSTVVCHNCQYVCMCCCRRQLYKNRESYIYLLRKLNEKHIFVVIPVEFSNIS